MPLSNRNYRRDADHQSANRPREGGRAASEVDHHARPLAARWRGRNERGERGRNKPKGLFEGTFRRDFSKGLSKGLRKGLFKPFQIEGTWFRVVTRAF